MNWYKLEIIRDVLEGAYDCHLAPGGIGEQDNLEVWQRVSVGHHTHRAFLNYYGAELLVPEDTLVTAIEALEIPPGEFLGTLKSRGGLFLGPPPR